MNKILHINLEVIFFVRCKSRMVSIQLSLEYLIPSSAPISRVLYVTKAHNGVN